jgi:hypothetical protein
MVHRNIGVHSLHGGVMRTMLYSGRERPDFDCELEARLRAASATFSNQFPADRHQPRVYALVNQHGLVYRTVTTYSFAEQHCLAGISEQMDLDWSADNEADFHPEYRAYIRATADQPRTPRVEKLLGSAVEWMQQKLQGAAGRFAPADTGTAAGGNRGVLIQ